MKRNTVVVLSVLILTFWTVAAAAAGDGGGFVPFDPAAEEQVSGKSLMIAAYAVICAVLGLYALSLFLRSRALVKRARHLEARVEKKSTDAGCAR